MEALVGVVRGGISSPPKKLPFDSPWIPSTAPILSEGPERPPKRSGGPSRHVSREPRGDPDNVYAHARISDFSQKQEIGRGRNTVIYSAVCSRTGERVAIKAHIKKSLTAIDVHRIKRESTLLRMLKHANIIQWLGDFEDESCIYLIQEYAGGGDLFESLKRWGGTMPEKRVVTQVLIPLMKALKEMHAKGVLHRDIKPENILIALDESIKVCDFGLAINVRLERPASRLGTLQYMAPEVVKRPFQRPRDMSKVDTYDEGVDIWACGILVYELIVGRPPFDDDKDEVITEQIMHQELTELPACMSKDCQDFVRGLLHKRSADRLSLEQMWQHPLITSHCKPEDLKPPRSARLAPSKKRPNGERPIDSSPIQESVPKRQPPIADSRPKPQSLQPGHPSTWRAYIPWGPDSSAGPLQTRASVHEPQIAQLKNGTEVHDEGSAVRGSRQSDGSSQECSTNPRTGGLPPSGERGIPQVASTLKSPKPRISPDERPINVLLSAADSKPQKGKDGRSAVPKRDVSLMQRSSASPAHKRQVQKALERRPQSPTKLTELMALLSLSSQVALEQSLTQDLQKSEAAGPETFVQVQEGKGGGRPVGEAPGPCTDPAREATLSVRIGPGTKHRAVEVHPQAWRWLRGVPITSKGVGIVLKQRPRAHVPGRTWTWLWGSQRPGSHSRSVGKVVVKRPLRLGTVAEGGCEYVFARRGAKRVSGAQGGGRPQSSPKWGVLSPSNVLDTPGLFSGSESAAEDAGYRDFLGKKSHIRGPGEGSEGPGGNRGFETPEATVAGPDGRVIVCEKRRAHHRSRENEAKSFKNGRRRLNPPRSAIKGKAQKRSRRSRGTGDKGSPGNGDTGLRGEGSGQPEGETEPGGEWPVSEQEEGSPQDDALSPQWITKSLGLQAWFNFFR